MQKDNLWSKLICSFLEVIKGKVRAYFFCSATHPNLHIEQRNYFYLPAVPYFTVSDAIVFYLPDNLPVFPPSRLFSNLCFIDQPHRLVYVHCLDKLFRRLNCVHIKQGCCFC